MKMNAPFIFLFFNSHCILFIGKTINYSNHGAHTVYLSLIKRNAKEKKPIIFMTYGTKKKVRGKACAHLY